MRPKVIYQDCNFEPNVQKFWLFQINKTIVEQQSTHGQSLCVQTQNLGVHLHTLCVWTTKVTGLVRL